MYVFSQALFGYTVISTWLLRLSADTDNFYRAIGLTCQIIRRAPG